MSSIWTIAPSRTSAASAYSSASPGRGDSLAPGFGPQLAFAEDVEVDRFDFVGPSRHGIHQKCLDIVKIGRLYREGGLAFGGPRTSAFHWGRLTSF
jgi:hypothetical protein